MKNVIKVIQIITIFCLLYIGFSSEYKVYGMDENGNVVVVIDPGHGGLGGESDDGAINGNITERHINMTVAKAMYEELSKFDGVKVYLTHDSADTSITLKNRSEFAKSVNADFLFSLHFNASEMHEKYGTEVWIPSVGSYYVSGYQFAEIELSALSENGLFVRGIKTRIGDDGDEYYGIIRESEWRGINAVIIEHCYVDNNEDRKYIENEDNLKKFGKIDAISAAKYFGLKSSELGLDYSGYIKTTIDEPVSRVYPDTTPPEKCGISIKNIDENNVTFLINAVDTGSYINYYSYSLDGGNTFSDLKLWNDGKTAETSYTKIISDRTKCENMEVTISHNYDDIGKLMVRVYNRDDVSSDSNVIDLKELVNKISSENSNNNKNESLKDGSDEPSADLEESGYYNEKNDNNQDKKTFFKNNKNNIIGIILLICGIVITVIWRKKCS